MDAVNYDEDVLQYEGGPVPSSSGNMSLEANKEVIGALDFNMSRHEDVIEESFRTQVKYEKAIGDDFMDAIGIKLEPMITEDVNIKEETDEYESQSGDSTQSPLQDFVDSDVVQRNYECATCSHKFKQKSNLRVHLTIHTGVKPYHCAFCNCKFSRNSTLKNHIRVHTGKKLYQCSTCESKVSTKAKLKIHIKTHTGEKPHQCSMCNSKFSKKYNLKGHMRTHTGEMPYECAKCHCKFSHKSTLDRHVRTHTGEKPFQCATCKCKFSVKRILNRHIRTRSCKKPL